MPPPAAQQQQQQQELGVHAAGAPAVAPEEPIDRPQDAAQAPAPAAAPPPAGARLLDHSVLSRIYFLWIWAPIRKAVRTGALAPEDAPGLPPGKHSARPWAGKAHLYDHIDDEWHKYREAGGQSLGTFLVRMCSADIAVSLLLGLLTAIMLTVVRPLLLKWFVEAVGEGDTDTAHYYLIGIFFAILVEGTGFGNIRHTFADRGGVSFVAICGHLLQAKALRLAPGTMGDTSPDSLLGNDVNRTMDSLRFLGTLPFSLMTLAAGLIVVILTAGGSGALGILFLVLGMVGSTMVSVRTKRREHSSLLHSDHRLSVMKRILDGIKAIKFSVWEDDFLRVLKEARDKEVFERQRFQNLQGITVNLGRAAPVTATMLTFVVKALTGGAVRASEAFATLAVFESLRICMINGPLGVTYFGAFRVSCQRIQAYLLLPEFKPPPALSPSEPDAVRLEGASFRWAQVRPAGDGKQKKRKRGTAGGQGEDPLEGPCGGSGALLPPLQKAQGAARLDGISLRVRRGALTGIFGPVGSGKSSLVCAIVGELEHVSGSGAVAVDPDIGYVPQKAFIVAGTVRHNVTMGRAMDEGRFAAAVELAQLERDLAIFPQGREQEIGERGITLSGGQQQRVAIARAVYGHPRLLILDDPLSAVDSAVGGAIFDALAALPARGYPGAPQSRPAVVMAANQLQFASQFAHCLFMRDCSVCEQGTHSALMAAAGPYARFYEAAVGDDHGGCTSDDEQRADTGASRVLTGSVEPGKVPAPAGGSGRQLLRADVRATGGIDSSVMLTYIKGGGSVLCAVVFILIGLGYVVMGFAAIVLARWAEETEKAEKRGEELDSGLNNRFVAVFGGAGLLHIALLMYAGAVLFPVFHKKAVRSIHDHCAQRVLRAPLSWFESTPSGRLAARFSSDMALIDVHLATGFEVSVAISMLLFMLAAVCTFVVPFMAGVFFVAYAAFFYVFHCFATTNREFKRMASMANAPVLTILGETLANRGQTVIRCMGFGNYYREQFAAQLDRYLAFQFASGSLMNWQILMGHSIGSLVATGAAMLLLHAGSGLSSGEVGLGLAYAFNVPLNFQTGTTFMALFRISLGGLERVLQLLGPDVEQEPEWHRPEDAALPAGWPASGRVRFDGATLVYRPGLAPAVDKVNLDFPAGSRVGIVGRTGAGKSSLFQLLFRLREATAGKVEVDGVDIATLGLRTLREHMVCLPQEPLLIDGNLRENLDPFGRHSDEVLRRALERVGLEGRWELTHVRLRPRRIRGDTISSATPGAVGGLRLYSKDKELPARPVPDCGVQLWELCGGPAPRVCAYSLRTLPAAHPSQDPSAWVLEGAPSADGPWRVLHKGDGAEGQQLPAGRGEWGPRLECDGDLQRDAQSLSAGERQLIALARALLRDAKVVVMDEPTSNVDAVTDAAVQRVIRTHLSNRTVVTIAHRLHTVIDADLIVVLDAGQVAECDTPDTLLHNPQGALAALARQLGPTAEAALREKARAARAGAGARGAVAEQQE